MLNQQEIYERRFKDNIVTNYFGKIFNAYVWDAMIYDTAAISRTVNNPKLFNNDPKLINDFVVQVITIKIIYRITNGFIEKAIHSADGLIAFLKKEYYMK